MQTFNAPADSPKIITRAGSRPKASAFVRTHVNAAIWSSSPKLPSTPPFSGSAMSGWAAQPKGPTR
jgi:hypothetical protein